MFLFWFENKDSFCHNMKKKVNRLSTLEGTVIFKLKIEK